MQYYETAGQYPSEHLMVNECVDHRAEGCPQISCSNTIIPNIDFDILHPNDILALDTNGSMIKPEANYEHQTANHYFLNHHRYHSHRHQHRSHYIHRHRNFDYRHLNENHEYNRVYNQTDEEYNLANDKDNPDDYVMTSLDESYRAKSSQTQQQQIGYNCLSSDYDHQNVNNHNYKAEQLYDGSEKYIFL